MTAGTMAARNLLKPALSPVIGAKVCGAPRRAFEDIEEECDGCGESAVACQCETCVRCGVEFGAETWSWVPSVRHPENPAICRGCHDDDAKTAAAMAACACDWCGDDGTACDSCGHDPYQARPMDIPMALREVGSAGLEWALDRSGHEDAAAMLADTDPEGAAVAAWCVLLGWFLRMFQQHGATLEQRHARAGSQLALLALAEDGARLGGRTFTELQDHYDELCSHRGGPFRSSGYSWSETCRRLRFDAEGARSMGVTL